MLVAENGRKWQTFLEIPSLTDRSCRRRNSNKKLQVEKCSFALTYCTYNGYELLMLSQVMETQKLYRRGLVWNLAAFCQSLETSALHVRPVAFMLVGLTNECPCDGLASCPGCTTRDGWMALLMHNNVKIADIMLMLNVCKTVTHVQLSSANQLTQGCVTTCVCVWWCWEGKRNYDSVSMFSDGV